MTNPHDAKKSWSRHDIYGLTVLLNFLCCYTPILESFCHFLWLGLNAIFEFSVPLLGIKIALGQLILSLLRMLNYLVWLYITSALIGTAHLLIVTILLMATLHFLLKAFEFLLYFAWTFIRLPAHIALFIAYEILKQEEMILLIARTLGEAIMQILLAFVYPLFDVMTYIPSTKKRTMRMDNPAFGGRGQGIHVREKNRFVRARHPFTNYNPTKGFPGEGWQ